MNITRIVIFITGVFLLFQCKSKKQETTPVLDFKLTIPPIRSNYEFLRANSIYGEWSYVSDNIFYMATIEIKKDGTFTYFDQGCLGKCYTEGTWVKDGWNLFLTSYDKYKKDNEIKVKYIESNQTISKENKPNKNLNKKKSKNPQWTIDTSLIATSMSITVQRINFPDTTNTFFDKKAFSFIGGFLYEANRNGHPENSMYFQTRKLR